MALFSKDSTPGPSAPPAPRANAQGGQLGGTLLGPNLVIEGTVTGSETMVIDGTVRGEINITSDVRVGTKGRVEAKIHARNIVIEGKVNGDISADDRVELVTGSQVEGNIKAPKIIVAEGARFRGSVDMGSKVPGEQQSAPKQ